MGTKKTARRKSPWLKCDIRRQSFIPFGNCCFRISSKLIGRTNDTRIYVNLSYRFSQPISWWYKLIACMFFLKWGSNVLKLFAIIHSLCLFLSKSTVFEAKSSWILLVWAVFLRLACIIWIYIGCFLYSVILGRFWWNFTQIASKTCSCAVFLRF